MTYRICGILLASLLFTSCSTGNIQQDNTNLSTPKERADAMISIISEKNEKTFCIPGGKTFLDVAEDLDAYSKNKNEFLTTSQMEIAFEKLYPCQ